MRLVAKKAGVSTSATYRHYNNKNDLKAEVLRKGFQFLNEGMKGLQTSDANFSASVSASPEDASRTIWALSKD